MKSALDYSVAAVLILVLAMLQGTGMLAVRGILPELALAGLVLAMFFGAPLWFLFTLMFLALSGLVWQTGIPREFYAFSGAFLAALGLKRILPWHALFEAPIAIAAAVLVFVLLADPRYLFTYPARMASEMLLTLASGIIIFCFFVLAYGFPRERQ